MISIVDYGVGNLGSIMNMMSRLQIDARIVRGPQELSHATKIILPGVGTFDAGMAGIRSHGLKEVLDCKALVERVPILGICLGAQLMTQASEEGNEPGLGWLDAKTRLFRFAEQSSAPLPLPHIGWCNVSIAASVAPFALPTDQQRFYFVHKYHFEVHTQITWMTAQYGYQFPCAIREGNLMCVQFHPEKSHRFGMAFLAGFANSV